jgi:hypothetical protein
MGVKFGKLKNKKYWLWKWTFGTDQQEHLKENLNLFTFHKS